MLTHTSTPADAGRGLLPRSHVAYSLSSLGLLPDASFDDARLYRLGVRSVQILDDDPAYPIQLPNSLGVRLQKDEELEFNGRDWLIIKKPVFKTIEPPRISEYMSPEIQAAINLAADAYRKECDENGIEFSDKNLPTKRQIREEWERHRLQWDRVAKRVGLGGAPVAQNDVLEHKIFRKKKTIEFARSQMMSPPEGDPVSLLDIMNEAQKQRFAERYKFIKAMETICEMSSLRWGMLTLTAPSEHHPSPKTGIDSFDDELTIKDTHKWLHRAWRKVLRRLKNSGITISGFRCVEFHEDGCPHWHIIFYYRPFDGDRIFDEVKKEWPLFDPEDPESIGAQWISGDNKKSKFASYASKYVLKSIAQGLDVPDLDNKEDRTALAYESLRSPFHIRGIQFFGLPSMGLWRSLRSMKEAPVTDSKIIISSWRAARGGDAVGFIGLQGGLAVALADRPLKGKTCRNEGEKYVELLDKTSDSDGEFIRYALPVWTRCAAFKATHTVAAGKKFQNGWQLLKVIQGDPKKQGQKLKPDGKRSLDFLLDDDSPSFFI